VKATVISVSQSNGAKTPGNDAAPAINSQDNKISVGFSVSGRVFDGTEIVISGLTSSASANDAALTVAGASAANYGSTGNWNQAAGTLTLTLTKATDLYKNSYHEKIVAACAAVTSLTTNTACLAVKYDNDSPYKPNKWGNGPPYKTASNMPYDGSVCEFTAGTPNTCEAKAVYKDLNNFPWGYFPQPEDTINQAVEFTIKNPAGYAGERAISVKVQKAVPVGSGADYPYTTSLPSLTKIFEGEPMVSATSIAETLPAGQTLPNFLQERSLTLTFSLNLVAGSTFSKVGKDTTFTVSGLVSSTEDTAALAIGGASAALFGSIGTVAKCSRTLVLKAASDILPANKDITLTFTLTSVAYALASTTVSLSSSAWLNTDTDTDIAPAIAVAGNVLRTVGTVPTSTFAGKALTRIAAGFGPVDISGLVVAETVALTSALECSQAYGGASATRTAPVVATGTSASLQTAGLGAAAYTACIKPNDGCGAAGVGNPTAGVLTIVKPTWSAVPATKVGDPTVVTITGGASAGDAVIVISSSKTCAEAFAFQGDATNINQKIVTAPIVVQANGQVTVTDTLADGTYRVCFLTGEMASAGLAFYQETDAAKTFTMDTRVVVPPTIVVQAGHMTSPAFAFTMVLGFLGITLTRLW
jgi:hypothetical protein